MSVVFFDVGATIVSGPKRGPASRLAERLHLNADAKKRLGTAIMIRDWQSPADVTAYLHEELDIEGRIARDASEDLWERQCHEATVIPGAIETVRAILDAGIRVGLISNIWRPYFYSARDCCGDLFARLTAPAASSCEEGIAKPCPDIFARAAARADVVPSRCVMVGDTYETDVSGAAAAGMRAIWVLHRPEVEAAALVRVLNGTTQGPHAAITQIADLTPGLIASVAR